MVKTVATTSTLNSPSNLVSSSSLGQPRTTTIGKNKNIFNEIKNYPIFCLLSGVISNMLCVTGTVSGMQGQAVGAQRLRPKPVTTTTVLPRGRSGSIVIPLTPNPASSMTTTGLQLKPVGIMPHKQTLHIKQDGSKYLISRLVKNVIIITVIIQYSNVTNFFFFQKIMIPNNHFYVIYIHLI
jgi:hypothetical protein